MNLFATSSCFLHSLSTDSYGSSTLSLRKCLFWRKPWCETRQSKNCAHSNNEISFKIWDCLFVNDESSTMAMIWSYEQVITEAASPKWNIICKAIIDLNTNLLHSTLKTLLTLFKCTSLRHQDTSLTRCSDVLTLIWLNIKRVEM